MHSHERFDPPGKPFVLAIDARNLADDSRGLGRYARAITREFLARDGLAVRLVVGGFVPALKRARLTNALASERFSLSRGIPGDAHVVWHPWNGIFTRARAPNVVTIADTGPFCFPADDERRREHQQRPFRDALSSSVSIITISNSAASDIVEHLGAQRQHIHVTYLGVDAVFCPGAAPPPLRKTGRGYFFFVGDVREPRKNFDTLYAAFRSAWPNDDGPALVVRGAHDPQRSGVLHVGITDDETLRSFYCAAIATCVPASYEGFGMPVVESMACGTPVLAANASSLPEAAGDAALLLPPGDVAAWSSAMLRVASDERERAALREAGFLQAAKFRWSSCADETLAVLRAAAGLPDRVPGPASAVRSSIS